MARPRRKWLWGLQWGRCAGFCIPARSFSLLQPLALHNLQVEVALGGGNSATDPIQTSSWLSDGLERLGRSNLPSNPFILLALSLAVVQGVWAIGVWNSSWGARLNGSGKPFPFCLNAPRYRSTFSLSGNTTAYRKLRVPRRTRRTTLLGLVSHLSHTRSVIPHRRRHALGQRNRHVSTETCLDRLSPSRANTSNFVPGLDPFRQPVTTAYAAAPTSCRCMLTCCLLAAAD